LKRSTETANKRVADKYEEYLKRIADLAKQVQAGHADDTPEQLKKSPAIRALYSNLKKPDVVSTATHHVAEVQAGYLVSGDPVLTLALKIDATVRATRPDGWRGIQTRENVIKMALLPLLGNDVAEVERIFLIIMQQGEY
jgi:type I restriction enzyme R subunit